MLAVIVYESMFGCTRQIGDAIAQGLQQDFDVVVTKASAVDTSQLGTADLLVVGAPTHAHGMPRPATREGAPDYVEKPGNDLSLETDAATDTGVREWLGSLGHLEVLGAAFDTRVKGSPVLTGQASRGIAKSLKGHGVTLLAPPESFLVDRHSSLLAGELDRARAWGSKLASVRMAELASRSK